MTTTGSAATALNRRFTVRFPAEPMRHGTRLTQFTAVAVTLVSLIAAPASLSAQQTREAAVAVDTAVSIDATVDENGQTIRGIAFDGVASMEFGRGLQLLARPSAQRIAATGEWNAQVWMAALRYEHPGPVAIRVDAGLIPSPIGIANLTLRPQLNPTIAQPSSLFTALPAPIARAPRTTLLGAIYPMGAAITASAIHWDARAAIIDSSPLRPRRIFASDGTPNAPRFATTVIGAGVTPFVGVRIGASVARGGWLQADETPSGIDRSATTLAIESEIAFRHTSVTGEWVRDVLETAGTNRTVGGWYVQAAQTLAPRWFAAGRVERLSSPPGAPELAGISVDQHLTGVEETLGYRISRELTVRVSHRARELFGSPEFAHTAAVSVVWWRRWM